MTDRIIWIKINNGELFEGTIDQFKDNFFSNATVESILEWAHQNQYIAKISNYYPFGRPPYDSNYGDDVMCQCGHPYYRHFDTYDKMSAVGCKYCGWECEQFQKA